MTAAEAQRFDKLSAWLKRNGIDYATREDRTSRRGSVFDDIYDSLEDLETAVKQELAQLLPKWHSAPEAQSPPRQTRSSIVDYVVVIGPDAGDIDAQTFSQGQPDVYEASVIFAHPPQCQFNAECIEQFCFPVGIEMVDGFVGDKPEDFFVLVLSGGGEHGQSVQYACCLRKQLRLSTATQHVSMCYAVVVATPWIPLFSQILQKMAAQHQKDLDEQLLDDGSWNVVPNTFVQFVDSMMASIAAVEPPQQGDMLELSLNSPRGSSWSFSCLRPRVDTGCPENVELLLDWTMPQLLTCLSIPRIILVVSLLLVEMKVIVVSKKMPQLSAGTLGFSALLNPLAWAGPLISVLPPSLLEYLEAPVPLLCGVDALPVNFAITKGTVIVEMEADEVQVHPDDAAQLGALQFPGSEELSRQLSALSSRMLSLNQTSSRVLLANVVVRRIHRQLEDLLLLCARVNPCNAYVCMKQEQLSLSETLFLKAFMQSQMYQKYSDDLPREPQPTQPAPKMQSIIEERPRQPSGQLSGSLRTPITQLFQLATAGSSIDEPTTDDHCGDANIKDVHRQTTAESPVSPTHIVENSPKLKAQRSPRDTSVMSEDQNDWDRHSSTSGDEMKMHATAEKGDNAEISALSPVNETLFALAPAAPATQSILRHLSSSTLSEGQSSHSQTELETQALTPSWSPVPMRPALSDNSPPVRQSDSRINLGPSPLPSTRHAARRIQITWRAWRLRQRQASQQRTLKRKSSSSASLRSTGCSTSVHGGATVDAVVPRLFAGTKLIQEHDGRAVNVHMALNEDTKSLVWRSESLGEVGRVRLVEIEEVRSEAGLILVHATDDRRYTFRSPPQQSRRVISFFQALHRLATSTSKQEARGNSGRASVDNTVAAPPPMPRQESSRVLGPSTVNEASLNEAKQSVHDIHSLGERQSTYLVFDDAIRKGILVLKHGRMGRPHPKFLMCDEQLQSLFWVDPRVTNAGFIPQPGMTGSLPHPQSIETKRIRFDEIVDVCHGKQTRVFQRSAAGRSNAELCFSIVTKHRTLDIEAFSQDDVKLLLEGVLRCVSEHTARR